MKANASSNKSWGRRMTEKAANKALKETKAEALAETKAKRKVWIVACGGSVPRLVSGRPLRGAVACSLEPEEQPGRCGGRVWMLFSAGFRAVRGCSGISRGTE